MVLKGRPYRTGADSLLETAVVPALGKRDAATCVVVLPQGDVGPGVTWRQWVFRAAHCGPLGGHRPADKTVAVGQRSAWSQGIADGVDSWA